MAKFFVGQRVRMARPVNRENFGAEGRIRAFLPREFMVIGGLVNCIVDWNRPTTGQASHTEQLEPILPEGHQPSEFETLHDLLHSLGVGVAA